MTRKEMLLTILAEECAETAQRVSKALRFTLEEIQPGQDFTNAERIVYEFNDICAMMEILSEGNILSGLYDSSAIWAKKEKIKKYLEYSEAVGALK